MFKVKEYLKGLLKFSGVYVFQFYEKKPRTQYDLYAGIA
jgi:hypothetical protein